MDDDELAIRRANWRQEYHRLSDIRSLLLNTDVRELPRYVEERDISIEDLASCMLDVVRRRNLGLLRFLVDRGVDPNGHFDHWTPLIGAVHEEWTEGIEYLLGAGADVDKKDSSVYLGGQTPLIHAVDYRKDLEIVQLLLRHGASTAIKDNDGKNVLMHVNTGKVDVATRLLEAVRRSVDAADIVDDKDSKGWTPLIHAVDRNNIRVAELLLDPAIGNASVDEADNNGWTALFWAIHLHDANAVELLLSRGASVEVKDNRGMTALICAVFGQDHEIIRRILDRGVNIDERYADGRTALSWAAEAKTNTAMVVTLLLDAGARVDEEDDSGRTALTFARNPAVIEVLCARGADASKAAIPLTKRRASRSDVNPKVQCVAYTCKGTRCTNMSRDWSTRCHVHS